MDDPDVFLLEENIISLRTAIILVDQNLVSVRLLPRWLDSSVPKDPTEELWDAPFVDFAWLYRCIKRPADNEPLHGLGPVEQGIRPMVFESPPKFELVWNDSGQSVAIYLNAEPWAFIHEQTRKGYSKGIVDPTIGCQWDEELFKKLFGKVSV